MKKENQQLFNNCFNCLHFDSSFETKEKEVICDNEKNILKWNIFKCNHKNGCQGCWNPKEPLCSLPSFWKEYR